MINRDSNQIVCHFVNNAQYEFVTFFAILASPSGPYLILTMVCSSNKFWGCNCLISGLSGIANWQILSFMVRYVFTTPLCPANRLAWYNAIILSTQISGIENSAVSFS